LSVNVSVSLSVHNIDAKYLENYPSRPFKHTLLYNIVFKNQLIQLIRRIIFKDMY